MRQTLRKISYIARQVIAAPVLAVGLLCMGIWYIITDKD